MTPELTGYLIEARNGDGWHCLEAGICDRDAAIDKARLHRELRHSRVVNAKGAVIWDSQKDD
jgi:hypothetical protein